MGETKNQKSRQDMQHGHQNEEPKKGQNPNDPKNKDTQHGQTNPPKQGQNDSKEGQQRHGIGTPHDKESKPTNR